MSFSEIRFPGSLRGLSERSLGPESGLDVRTRAVDGLNVLRVYGLLWERNVCRDTASLTEARNCHRPKARLEVRGDLGGPPLVTMMESADLRNRNDRPLFGRPDGPSLRRVLLQSQVCPGSMIVIEEISKVPVKAAFVEYDDVVQALAANGSDDPLDISTLPRRAWRGQDLFDPHGLNLMNEVLPKDPIAVPQQVTWRCVPWKSLSKLLNGPSRCGMSCHSKVENSPALVCQHHKHIQDLKSDRRYREEIDGNHTLHMVLKKGSPGLRWRSSPADHVFAYAGFADKSLSPTRVLLTGSKPSSLRWQSASSRLVEHRREPGNGHPWQHRKDRAAFPKPAARKAL